MAASSLSVVLKGGWPNLDCARLCTKAVKWLKHTGAGRPRQGLATLYGQLASRGLLPISLYTSFIKVNNLQSNILFV